MLNTAVCTWTSSTRSLLDPANDWEPPTISLRADVDYLSTRLKEGFFFPSFFSFFFFNGCNEAHLAASSSERSLRRVRLWQCYESILDSQGCPWPPRTALELMRLTLNLCKEC